MIKIHTNKDEQFMLTNTLSGYELLIPESNACGLLSEPFDIIPGQRVEISFCKYTGGKDVETTVISAGEVTKVEIG